MIKQKNISVFKLKIINASLFIFFSFIFEIMFFALTFSWFLPPLFFLDLFLLIFLISIIFFFKKNLFDKIYIPILLFIVCLCFSLNAIFYKVANNIFVLENFKNLNLIFGRVGDHSNEFSWPIFFLFLGIYLVFLIAFFTINLIFVPEYSSKRRTYKIPTIFLVGSCAIYSLGINVTSIVERNMNNHYIDSVSSSSIYITKKIGLLTYYAKNLSQLMFSTKLDEDQLIDYFTDSSYLTTDLTGLLSGYNVITITIETGGEYMLNEYTTPNLYRLLKNGIHCSHNYCKNRTLYSELLGIVGNSPSIEFENTNILYKIPFGMPELLNGADYDTYYFQDLGNNNDIFGQKGFMKNIGYKNCFYHYDLLPDKEEFSYDYDNWERDSVVFSKVVNKLESIKGKFYAHYTTTCMHARYTDESCRASLTEPLKAEFKSTLLDYESKGLWTNPVKGKTPEEEHYFNYTLCTMDFDKGLGILLDYLDKANLTDKTLLVVYGDHNCSDYYLDLPMSWQIAGKDNSDEVANYQTILGFYNPKLNEYCRNNFHTNEFTKFSSPTVIVPTILDLLGIKFNPKFYQGKSIFDSTYENEVFYSMMLQRYMNENYLSYIGINVDKVFDDNNTKNQFIDNCSKLSKQQKYIDYIYNNNIFETYDYNKFLPKNGK